MLSPEERALLTDLQDRIIEQLVRRDEAHNRNDRASVAEAQIEIDRLTAECDLLRAEASRT